MPELLDRLAKLNFDSSPSEDERNHMSKQIRALFKLCEAFKFKIGVRETEQQ